MYSKQDVVDIILKSIDKINQEEKLQISKDTKAKLFGKGGNLDSLGLVYLITLIEEYIEELTGDYIPIADERAFLLESSPFSSIDTLAHYIETLINE